ncbi:biotin--acetyl-CoA-carboxylase ligase [Bacillus sp. TS-2]|nr:biotin--acetyl-CoA-carboxylase ligase [Bacillus sp. TS-2]
MKELLLKILVENKGTFISGEKLSTELNCSRTAIWKHMDALRKSGYKVESAPKKGYRLTEIADGIQPHDIQLYLQTKKIGHKIHSFDTLPSTQIIARELVLKGAKEGEVIITNEQTAGRGRLGRAWHTSQQKALAFSLLLKPAILPRDVPKLTLVTAVAVIRAIKELTKLPVQIKWPNDIILNGKKLAGILTEMQSEADSVHCIIVGIGLNVNQTEEDIPTELKDIATSLKMEGGQEYRRAALLAKILEEIECLYELYLSEGFLSIKAMWESHAIHIGTTVEVHTIQETIQGIAQGINDDGALQVMDRTGKLHSVYSADVSIKKT